jgi:hypothetical protein
LTSFRSPRLLWKASASRAPSLLADASRRRPWRPRLLLQAIFGAMPPRPSRPVLHDIRRTLVHLRAATKTVAQQMKKERRRLREERKRMTGSAPPALDIVCRFPARNSTDSVNLIATCLLQHNPRQLVTVSAQQRFAHAAAIATDFIDKLLWPDPFVDLPPSLRSPSWQRALERVRRRVQEFSAAKWTAAMNVENRIAPASSQVTSQWTEAQSPVFDAVIRRPLPTLTPRSRRRRLQMWKRRRGFCWGKMKIRDSFADQELRKKAGPATHGGSRKISRLLKNCFQNRYPNAARNMDFFRGPPISTTQ